MKKKLLFLLIIASSFLLIQKVGALTCKYQQYKDTIMDDNYIEIPQNIPSNSGSISVDLTSSSTKIDGKSYTIRNATKSPNEIVNSETAYVYNNQYTDEFYNSISILDDSVKNYYGLNDKNNVPKSNTRLTDYKYIKKCPPYLVYFDGTKQAYVASSESDSIDMVKVIWLTNSRKKGTITIEKNIDDSSNSQNNSSKYTSCASFTKPTGPDSCTSNSYFSCLWVEKYGHSYCNFDNLTYVKCGDAWDIPDKLPSIISFLVNFIKIVTPIILVFVSIISLVKATASSKEDDMKKAQNTLIRRIIIAALVFFIIQITQFVIFKVADDEIKGKNGKTEADNMSSCLSCFLNNDCSKNRYYKTMVGNQYECRYLDGTQMTDCH